MKQRERELRVVKTMIGIYCRGNHGRRRRELCDECARLLDYAAKRIEFCPRSEVKTTCRLCPTHCYSPARREEIRRVMRYAGPRMLFHSPIDAIRHLIEEKIR